jgi:hypothetical protein
MISGTIIGEIISAITSVLNGISARLSASAANVPSEVEISVAKIAMMKLFLVAWIHCALFQLSDSHSPLQTLVLGAVMPLVMMSMYQRQE